MWQLSSRELDGLRACLRPEYVDMPSEDLEAVVEPVLARLPGTAAEDFLGSLSSVGRTVGPVLQRAAPNMAQGAATGAAVGGPWGAAAGGTYGLLSSALSGSGKQQPASAPTPPPPGPWPTGAATQGAIPPAAAMPGAVSPAAPMPGAVSPVAPMPGAVSPVAPTPGAVSPVAPTPGATLTPEPLAAAGLPTGAQAAAVLLWALDQPLVKASLVSQVLGGRGLPEIPTATGARLRRAEINGMLTQLLANATEDLPEVESISDEEYLRGESGEFLIDPASPEQRAALVLAHLQQSRSSTYAEQVTARDEMADWSVVEFLAAESEEWLQPEAAGWMDGNTEDWVVTEDIGEVVSFF